MEHQQCFIKWSMFYSFNEYKITVFRLHCIIIAHDINLRVYSVKWINNCAAFPKSLNWLTVTVLYVKQTVLGIPLTLLLNFISGSIWATAFMRQEKKNNIKGHATNGNLFIIILWHRFKYFEYTKTIFPKIVT